MLDWALERILKVCPLVWRRSYDTLSTENYTLRDALKSANDELRKHRALIAGLRTGQPEVLNSLDRALKK